jgi:hypothetical protein
VALLDYERRIKLDLYVGRDQAGKKNAGIDPRGDPRVTVETDIDRHSFPMVDSAVADPVACCC